jgi:nucleotide-binding universal stress UspA family protein
LSVIDPAWKREFSRHSPPQGELGPEELRAIATQRIEDLARTLPQADEGRFEVEVVEGVPLRVLVERAAQWPADCVVVGRHGHGPFAERLLGSTTLDLIHHAARDVLVVS